MRTPSPARLQPVPGTADDTDVPADPTTDAPPARRERRAEPGTMELTDEPTEQPTGERAAERRRRRSGSRPSLPLVPVLAVLLVLLLAAAGALLLTWPQRSAVRTDSYVGALQAARAGIVDVTSFDYLTLDDDIAQIRAVTTGDLQTEAVGQLDGQRQALTAAQAVVNSEVVGAAVTAAGEDSATVLVVLQSTQQSAGAQPQVTRFRVQVDLTRTDGRWLLSGISGR